MSKHSPSEELKMTVGRAIGRLPSGVYILTARQDGKPLVMMASWVQQAAFDPPAVSVAIAKDRPVREALNANPQFALAVVAEGDSAIMRKYARGIPPGEDPFEGVEVARTKAGLPIPKSALAYLDCRVLKSFDFGGDHELCVARVESGELLREGEPFTHVRGNGFHY